MARFLLSYHGGTMGDTPDQQAAQMAKWMAWFGSLGAGLVDQGRPISTARTVASDGSVAEGGGANMVTGYTVIDATDLDAAVRIARGCPLLQTGGSIEVGQTLDMG